MRVKLGPLYFRAGEGTVHFDMGHQFHVWSSRSVTWRQGLRFARPSTGTRDVPPDHDYLNKFRQYLTASFCRGSRGVTVHWYPRPRMWKEVS
jgi:hypothetical protein